MPKWRLSVPKNTKWWDFVNFCLRCCQETEIQHGNRPLHLTQHRHCLSMCQEWNDVRSDGSRRSKGLLAADSWSTESEFLHSDCLENLQSWGDFLLILWTTLGSCSRSEEMTFHLKYRMGGVQKFSFRVHKFIIVHAAVCLSYINGIVEIVQFICVILQLRMPFLCCHSQYVCMYCIRESQNAFTWDFEIIVYSFDIKTSNELIENMCLHVNIYVE